MSTTSKPPVLKFRAGLIQASVWENETKDGKKYRSVTFQRSYKDAQDQWHHTDSFSTQDLPALALLAAEVFSVLGIKDEAESKGGPAPY